MNTLWRETTHGCLVKLGLSAAAAKRNAQASHLPVSRASSPVVRKTGEQRYAPSNSAQKTCHFRTNPGTVPLEPAINGSMLVMLAPISITPRNVMSPPFLGRDECRESHFSGPRRRFAISLIARRPCRAKSHLWQPCEF